MATERIQRIIDDTAAKTTARLGVFFKNLSTGETAGTRIDEVFPTASVFKVFVLAELLRRWRQEGLSLGARLPLLPGDRSEGSGVLAMLGDGITPTLLDYAHLMMMISDNTAADILFNLLGRDAIRENVLEPLGLVKTKCDLSCRDLIAVSYNAPAGRPYGEFDKWCAANRASFGENWAALRNAPAYTGGLERNDETTPFEVAKILEAFHEGKWVDSEASAKAVEIMLKCQTNARIPKYLPAGCRAAHKTGSMLRVANDAGIVYTPRGDFILSLFYNGNVASEEEYAANASGRLGDELLANLSRDVCTAFLEG